MGHQKGATCGCPMTSGYAGRETMEAKAACVGAVRLPRRGAGCAYQSGQLLPLRRFPYVENRACYRAGGAAASDRFDDRVCHASSAAVEKRDQRPGSDLDFVRWRRLLARSLGTSSLQLVLARPLGTHSLRVRVAQKTPEV